MKSPFPGMDPYLEQRWGDLHVSLITYIRDALQPFLGDELRARIGERVYVEWFDGESRQLTPDVHVYEHPRRETAGGGGTAVAVADDVAVARPTMVFVQLEVTERYVQIVDVRSGGRVVTIIELLSPANKSRGKGREEYAKKQHEVVQAGLNLVEIDLHRAGEPATLAKPGLLPPDQWALYHTSVYRGTHPDRLEYYGMPLRQRLPRIPIPLRPTDPRVVLDLQAVLDTAYDRGRYDDVDYSQPLKPPLDPADEQWAGEVLAAARAAAGRPPR